MAPSAEPSPVADVSRSVATSSKLGDTSSKQQQSTESLSQDLKFLGIEEEADAREAEVQEKSSDSDVQEAIDTACAAAQPMEEHAPEALAADRARKQHHEDAQDREVYAMYVEKEHLYLADPDYMATKDKKNLNEGMRAILFDWLFEVTVKYKFRIETFFLAVNIVDRYLARKQVPRDKLQLLGVVAMFIASKYEEIDPPKVSNMSYISTYTTNDIIQMEIAVLNELEHDIAGTTVAHVFEHLQRINQCDDAQRKLTLYALTLATHSLKFLRYTPSHLVSAALLIGNEKTSRITLWSEVMAHHTGYSFDSLQRCRADLDQTMGTAWSMKWLTVNKIFWGAPSQR